MLGATRIAMTVMNGYRLCPKASDAGEKSFRDDGFARDGVQTGELSIASKDSASRSSRKPGWL